MDTHVTQPSPSLFELPPRAIKTLEKIANQYGATPAAVLDALLHYATSIYERPGSWEASKAFDFHDYDIHHEQAFADRWW